MKTFGGSPAWGTRVIADFGFEDSESAVEAAVAGFVDRVLAMVAICYQTWKCAGENPIDSPCWVQGKAKLCAVPSRAQHKAKENKRPFPDSKLLRMKRRPLCRISHETLKPLPNPKPTRFTRFCASPAF